MPFEGVKLERLEPNLNGFVENAKESLFSRGIHEGDPRRGSMSFMDDTHAVVQFFRSADFSTAPHEIYHIFRREMEQTALHGTAQEKADWDTICDFVGARDGVRWSREQEEKFALAAERYLAEGEAPSIELAGVFQRLKQWFLNLYQDISNAGVEISPAMRRVFDRMLSADLPRNDYADLLRMAMSPAARRDILRATEKALMDFGNGDAVNVRQILQESKALREAYDTVLGDPLGGDQWDVLASLNPEDIENVFVHRGPARQGDDGNIEVYGRRLEREKGSRRGFGMVKIIYAHGEKGNKKEGALNVTKNDVIALPRLIREYEPTVGERSLHWHIPYDDKHTMVIIANKTDKRKNMLVSMYIGDKLENESKKRSSPLNPHSRGLTENEIHSRGLNAFTPAGQRRTSNSNITENSSPVNTSTTALHG